MNIDEKIEELYRLKEARWNETKDLEAQLKDIEHAIKEKSKPFDAEMIKLEDEIKEDVLDFRKKYEHPLADVTYRKGYIRTSWDTKHLDIYSLTHPEVKKYRNETNVKPSASIKWI